MGKVLSIPGRQAVAAPKTAPAAQPAVRAPQAQRAPQARPAPQGEPVPPPLPTQQRELQDRQEQPTELHEPGEGWLTIRSIVKSFKKRTVVRGVSLDVRRGEAVGLLGPNGAGKTTTFYMITGLIPADEGSIKIDGQDVTKLPMYRRARLGIGYLPQEASIFRGLTVEENILGGSGNGRAQ